MSEQDKTPPGSGGPLRRRRVRYSGKNPVRYEDRYKEHNPDQYTETIATLPRQHMIVFRKK